MDFTIRGAFLAVWTPSVLTVRLKGQERRYLGIDRMKTYSKAMAMLLWSFAFLWAPASQAASNVLKEFDNRSFYCKGGNESAGHLYQFSAHGNKIERIDHRFPGQKVQFEIGQAKKGQLGTNWSFETLSEVRGGRMHLYERVSLRGPQQNKHVYRTYEMYARGNKMFMVLYDGVNGARDWKIRMTRSCGYLRGNRIVQNGNRYWSTTFAR